MWLCARFWCVRSGVALGDGMYRRHVRDRRDVGACGWACDVVCRRVWWGAKVAKGPEMRVAAAVLGRGHRQWGGIRTRRVHMVVRLCVLQRA